MNVQIVFCTIVEVCMEIELSVPFLPQDSTREYPCLKIKIKGC